MRRERGQATVEWIVLVLLVAVALAGALALGPRIDGRSFGGFLAHRIVCTARGGCDDGDDALRAAYGARMAALVRRYAPNLVYEPGTYTLPVDWRECRAHRCSDAAYDRDLDAALSSRTGARATVFTHVVRRAGRTYLQYWFYYPDSTSTFAGSAAAWRATLGHAGLRYPGFHPDDWEGYQVAIGADGRPSARATAHGGYQSCKERRCHNRWGAPNGWSRVSRGSHAGHIPAGIPGRGVHERTTNGERLQLVPLERIDPRSYRRLPGGIDGPWGKPVYSDPASDSS